MASKKDKRKTLVYLIPEGETRDSHTYHYTALKTKRLTIENQKLKLRKYNPVKRSKGSDPVINGPPDAIL